MPLDDAGAKAGKRVTLMVPWLHKVEQPMIFPNGLSFETPAEQEAHIRTWLKERGGMDESFRLAFYPGRYDVERGSILPLGDITRFFDEEEVRAGLASRNRPCSPCEA